MPLPARPLGAAALPTGICAARRQQLLVLAAAALVFAVPAAAFAALILHHFYVSGSFMLDAGWTAYLVSHGGLALPYPKVLGGESYFHFHITPVFWPLALLRRALPVSDIQYFAGYTGLCHALSGLAVLWILHTGYQMRRGIALALAAAIAVVFAFNGLALAIVRYPHSEILVAGSLCLFAVALALRRRAIAAVFFAVALLTREDAGLHVFALMFALVAVNRRYGMPWRMQRAELAFGAVGASYSLTVIAAQRALSSAASTMTITYLGSPPFAHLSADIVLTRLHFWVTYRACLVLPALIAAIWAVRTGNPYLLVGYVAFLPWALLQLVAKGDIAGTLSGYYAYPFLIASFWPLVGVLLDPRRDGGRCPPAPLLAFCLMVAASFVGIAQQYNPGQLELPAALLLPPSIGRQDHTDHALAALTQSKAALGILLVDTGVAALMPDDFTPRETLERQQGPLRPNTVVYLVHGFDSATLRRIAAERGLNRHYSVPGTALRLSSDHPMPPESPIAALLVSTETAD